MIAVESRPTVWLPDDLEERWEKMEPVERRDVIRYWRERNANGTMGWRERRRIRKLIGGGPLTQGHLVNSAERMAEEEQERQAYLRLVRLYGPEGQQAIQALACRAAIAHPGAPFHRLEVWAEKAYVRGDVG